MQKKFVRLGTLKKGKMILIEGEACKIIGMEHSAPGRHGAARIRLTGITFDGKKKQLLKSVDADVEIPIIEKASAQVVAITQDKAQLMDLTTYQMYEITIPNEFKGKIEPGIEVIITKIGQQIQMEKIK